MAAALDQRSARRAGEASCPRRRHRPVLPRRRADDRRPLSGEPRHRRPILRLRRCAVPDRVAYRRHLHGDRRFFAGASAPAAGCAEIRWTLTTFFLNVSSRYVCPSGAATQEARVASTYPSARPVDLASSLTESTRLEAALAALDGPITDLPNFGRRRAHRWGTSSVAA